MASLDYIGDQVRASLWRAQEANSGNDRQGVEDELLATQGYVEQLISENQRLRSAASDLIGALTRATRFSNIPKKWPAQYEAQQRLVKQTKQLL